MYLKANKLIAPRRVRDLEAWPKELQLKPDGDAHWVGWIAVQNAVRTPTFYAAWQDYKRRGFYIQRLGEKPYETAFGSTLNDLLAAVEHMHNEEPSDMPNFSPEDSRDLTLSVLEQKARRRPSTVCNNLDRALRLHVAELKYHDRVRDQMSLLLDLGYEAAFVEALIKMNNRPVLGKKLSVIYEAWKRTSWPSGKRDLEVVVQTHAYIDELEPLVAELNRIMGAGA
jgi:hypothetical protein